jgi:hypothetical protein
MNPEGSLKNSTFLFSHTDSSSLTFPMNPPATKDSPPNSQKIFLSSQMILHPYPSQKISTHLKEDSFLCFRKTHSLVSGTFLLFPQIPKESYSASGRFFPQLSKDSFLSFYKILSKSSGGFFPQFQQDSFLGFWKILTSASGRFFPQLQKDSFLCF